jgi:Tfp pilus assembly pilus retraction ATPase PilT
MGNHTALVVQEGEHEMRKILSFGIAALLTLGVIATWATGSGKHTTASAALVDQINPFELMKDSRDLPAEQYDTH